MAFSGNGTGTQADPYQIVTPAHFNEFLNWAGGNTVNTYYSFMNDIDLTGVTLAQSAQGSLHHLDAQGFKLINPSRTSTGGFDGLIATVSDGGSVKNLVLENPYLSNTGGNGVVGLIAGTNRGCLYENVSIVNGELVANLGNVGTFVGKQEDNQDGTQPLGNILNCRSTATLTHTATTVVDDIGGFVGNTLFGGNAIDKCYCASPMTIDPGNTSTAIGGFVGQSDRNILNSFYDQEVGLNQAGAGPRTKGTPKTTAEMKTLSTYTTIVAGELDEAWDIVAESDHVAQTWFLPTGYYPRLYFEEKTVKMLGPITKDGVLQSGVMVQVTAYDNDAKNSGKQDVGDYVSDVDGMITIPLADIPEGKTIFFAPHYKDGTSLFSDQLKSTI